MRGRWWVAGVPSPPSSSPSGRFAVRTGGAPPRCHPDGRYRDGRLVRRWRWCRPWRRGRCRRRCDVDGAPSRGHAGRGDRLPFRAVPAAAAVGGCRGRGSSSSRHRQPTAPPSPAAPPPPAAATAPPAAGTAPQPTSAPSAGARAVAHDRRDAPGGRVQASAGRRRRRRWCPAAGQPAAAAAAAAAADGRV